MEFQAQQAQHYMVASQQQMQSARLAMGPPPGQMKPGMRVPYPGQVPQGMPL